MKTSAVFSRVLGILRLGQRRERLKFALTVWLQDPILYPLKKYPPFDMGLCVNAFIRNVTLLHDYVRTNGARALTYLEPFNGFGNRRTSPADRASVEHFRRRVTVDGINELEIMREFYGRAAAEFRRLGPDELHDLTDVFDRYSGEKEVFIDQVHCSDIGYDMIGKRIAKDILEQEKRAMGQEQETDGSARYLEAR